MPITLPQGDSCIFCDRLKGRSDDWAVVDETPEAVAFINPRQFEVGQALVIPRRHAPTILDLTEAEAAALMVTVRRLSIALVAAFDPDGLTIYQNNGAVSLQEVPHVHVHVVPRRAGSGWGEGPPHIAAMERPDERVRRRTLVPLERQKELAGQIRAKLP